MWERLEEVVALVAPKTLSEMRWWRRFHLVEPDTVRPSEVSFPGSEEAMMSCWVAVSFEYCLVWRDNLSDIVVKLFDVVVKPTAGTKVRKVPLRKFNRRFPKAGKSSEV